MNKILRNALIITAIFTAPAVLAILTAPPYCSGTLLACSQGRDIGSDPIGSLGSILIFFSLPWFLVLYLIFWALSRRHPKRLP
jgi:hypothetical protein